MRRVRVLASVAVGVLVAVVAPLSAASAAGAAGAARAAVRCGDTVTRNVVLTRNLTCPGDGLIIGADDLTINLNGHTLTGSGVGIGIGGSRYPTVTNGTIRHFDVGVWGKADTRKVKFVSNRLGMRFDSGGGATILDSTFDSNGSGLIIGVGNVTVTGSTFRRNGVGMGCGDADLLVERSRFVDNTTGISGSVCGARIQESSFRGGDIAVRLNSQGYFLDVRNNSFTRSGIGISLSGVGDSTHAIVGNVFKNNGASGLVVNATNSTFGYPVAVAGNTFTRNGFDPGSTTDPTGEPLTSGVWANSGTFSDNRANANAGHGIEGYDVIDGRGNTARSNAAEPQCIGVVCAAR